MISKVLIDTDILSYFFKGHPVVRQHVNQYLGYHDCLSLSLISYYEILSGLMHKQASQQLQTFKDFVSVSEILSPTLVSMQKSAEAYAWLRHQGTPLDDMDLFNRWNCSGA